MVEEETVCRNAFELIFAFDEARPRVRQRARRRWTHRLTRLRVQVISLGHKENVTLAQVRTYTEMESHEEKLHKMIIQSKINDTKDLMKRKATEIDKSKLERKAERGFGPTGGFGGGGVSSTGGISSSTYFADDDRGGMGGGMGGMGGPRAPPPTMDDGFGRPSGKDAAPRAAAPSKGLVLGKGPGKTAAFIDQLRAEGEAVEQEVAAPRRPGGPAAGGMAAAALGRPAAGSAESVEIIVEEKLTCTLKKDGGLEALEVQGTMQLEIHNDEDAFCRVAVAPLSAAAAARGVQFKTHPNIDKALHANSNVLALKDASRPFPTGSALGILKWRCAPREESAVPLQLNCWPSVSGAQSFVSIEYEATSEFELENVRIAIPVPQAREPPSVSSCDGDFRFDSRKSCMLWSIDLIDAANRSGSMEFVVPAADAGAFFPIDVSFSSRGTFCGVQVAAVERLSDGAAVKHTVATRLATDSYTVQ